MSKLLAFLILVVLPYFAFADIDGSYEYSKRKYPEITQFLNNKNAEGNSSLVNIEMPNDGIFSLGKSNNQELLLVNYITFNMSAINYDSVVVKRNGINFEYSGIELPTPYRIKHEGSMYSLHKQQAEARAGTLVVKYSFTCKLPATFISVGDCSDHKVYNTELTYTLQNGELILTNTDIKI